MCLPNFVKFSHCHFKILKNQNVADGLTDGRTNKWMDNVKTVYFPQTQFAGGINMAG